VQQESKDVTVGRGRGHVKDTPIRVKKILYKTGSTLLRTKKRFGFSSYATYISFASIIIHCVCMTTSYSSSSQRANQKVELDLNKLDAIHRFESF
jgi:hypothetical protein